jgi:hypothetical protein
LECPKIKKEEVKEINETYIKIINIRFNMEQITKYTPFSLEYYSSSYTKLSEGNTDLG